MPDARDIFTVRDQAREPADLEPARRSDVIAQARKPLGLPEPLLASGFPAHRRVYGMYPSPKPQAHPTGSSVVCFTKCPDEISLASALSFAGRTASVQFGGDQPVPRFGRCESRVTVKSVPRIRCARSWGKGSTSEGHFPLRRIIHLVAVSYPNTHGSRPVPPKNDCVGVCG